MRITLIVISILVLVMGIMGAIPALTIGTEPIWHAIIKMVIGAVGLIMGIRGR
jgi:hypothetical protein